MVNKITISKDLIKDIIFEDYNEDIIEIVEHGHWIDDGKYSFINKIFKMNDKYWSLSVSRSGAYYSDYHYEWEDTDEFEVTEVKQIEVKVKKWVAA